MSAILVAFYASFWIKGKGRKGKEITLVERKKNEIREKQISSTLFRLNMKEKEKILKILLAPRKERKGNWYVLVIFLSV